MIEKQNQTTISQRRTARIVSAGHQPSANWATSQLDRVTKGGLMLGNVGMVASQCRINLRLFACRSLVPEVGDQFEYLHSLAVSGYAPLPSQVGVF